MSDQSHLEFRQLTVMFCDIVDSTKLSQLVDAETWRTFLENYQHICTQIISKYGGHVYEYRGDGPLVYFGYPTAFEDNAYRAVAAAFEIREYFIKLSESGTSPLSSFEFTTPKVRISVHTGSVITGEMRGRLTATGSMIALAERLQREASPNNIIISRETSDLVKSRFLVTELGYRSLKGFDQTCECFQVIGQASLSIKLTPFLGREAELNALTEVWKNLTPGKPVCHVINGEAGVGKSRLVTEFGNTLDKKYSKVLTLQCSPFYQNSSFYPIVSIIKELMQENNLLLPENESNIFNPSLIEKVPLNLHGVLQKNLNDFILISDMSSDISNNESCPEEKRDATLNGLIEWLSGLSQHSPLLLIVEDVHWIDPSTLELLKRLTQNSTCGPIFIVLTYRENSTETWTSPFPGKIITLRNISEYSTNQIIKYLVGDYSLPRSLVKKIVQRADGIPLFIEELSRMTVDKFKTINANEFDDFEELNIPSSIRDLLTVRLNDLGGAFEIAQVASVIGREFSIDSICKISDKTNDEITSHLQTMEIAGLINKKPSASHNEYQFKHSLVSDAAYASIINSHKSHIHRRLAKSLEADYLNRQPLDSESMIGRNANQKALEPEIIAHHFTRANMKSKAIHYWLKAGQHSKRQSAQKEAISHYKQVIALLQSSLKETEIDIPSIKMNTLLSLAACSDAVYGYSSKSSLESYRSAEGLAIELEDQNALLMARFGLQGCFLMRGDFNRAREYGMACWEMVENGYWSEKKQIREYFSHPMSKAQAAFGLGCVQFHQAEFDKALNHMESCIELCDGTSAKQRRLRHDPVVMCLVYKAWYTWETGQADEALNLATSAVAMARESGSAFGTGIALAFLACIHLFRREYKLTISIATESISISEEPGYITWLAWAKVLRGRAMCEFRDQKQSGITEVIQGLSLWDMSEAVVTRPFALALLAECYQINAEYDNALKQILLAIEMVERFGEKYFLAKIYITYGNLLTAGPTNNNFADAEKAYRSAIDFAKARNMQSSILIATIGLSRLYSKQKMFHEAAAILRNELGNDSPTAISKTKDSKLMKEISRELDDLEEILAIV